MPGFPSWRSYYDFAQSVTKDWRYTRNSEQAAFLDALWQTSKAKHEQIREGSFLWRAQVGHDWRAEYVAPGEQESFPCAFPPERMVPLRDRASEGRANPKGIPYLYLATVKETAIAEVRPWIGVLVSVAQFQTQRQLTVVNCTEDDRHFMLYLKEPKPAERRRAVWRDVDRAFARPVSQNEHVADYVPTQVIAELFRSRGLDGVAYRSSLGGGHNIVLFDIAAAELIHCGLVEVTSVVLKTRQADNPYAVRRRSDAGRKGSSRGRPKRTRRK